MYGKINKNSDYRIACSELAGKWLYKDRTFEKIGLSKWYIINFAQQMYKLSPPEKRMVLDLGELMHE